MKIELFENVEVSGVTPFLQLNKITEEIEEVKKEVFNIKRYFSGDENIDLAKTMENLAEEINDARQALTTLELMYFNKEQIITNNEYHIEKMNSRYKKK